MTSQEPFLRVIDLETTGQGFADGGVVEIGWQDVARGPSDTWPPRGPSDTWPPSGPSDAWPPRGPSDAWSLRGAPGALLIHPGHPISPATSAIHHIIDADVAAAPQWTQAAPGILQPDGRPIALAAHRSAFEQRWCTPALSGQARWICTYKCALRLWPEAPTHSNQGLRYWRMPAGLDRATGLPAHRAGPDAYVTAHHLRDMLALASVDQLLAWSAQPALLVRVPFGPWRGRAWGDLDAAALDRIIAGESGGNQDVAFTARHERTRRQGGTGAATASPAQSALTL